MLSQKCGLLFLAYVMQAGFLTKDSENSETTSDERFCLCVCV